MATTSQSTNVNSRYSQYLTYQHYETVDHLLLLKTLFFTWLPAHLILIVCLLSHWPFSVSLASSYSTPWLLPSKYPGPLLYLQCTLIPLVISSSLMTLKAIYVQRTPKFICLTSMSKMSKTEHPTSPCTLSPQKPPVLQAIFPIFINNSFQAAHA